jgi:hypothetical protein
MSNITTFLKVIASVPILVGVLHLVLGLNADVLLGAKLSASVIADPALPESVLRCYFHVVRRLVVCRRLGPEEVPACCALGALDLFRGRNVATPFRLSLRLSPTARHNAFAARGGGNSRSAGVAESFKPSRLAKVTCGLSLPTSDR